MKILDINAKRILTNEEELLEVFKDYAEHQNIRVFVLFHHGKDTTIQSACGYVWKYTDNNKVTRLYFEYDHDEGNKELKQEYDINYPILVAFLLLDDILDSAIDIVEWLCI